MIIMIITVTSGKGGTGKTLISLSLLSSVDEGTLIDADVEAPNDNLFLRFSLEKATEVYKKVPIIDQKSCTFCKACAEACEYNAIAIFPKKTFVTDDLCHGCGLCGRVCPVGAISFEKKSMGIISTGFSSSNPKIKFVEGKLNIGEAMASAIIKELKSGYITKIGNLTIIDSPPGSACPVVESMRDTDFVLLITEPTPFGLHDLEITVDVAKILNIPFGIVINRSTIGDKSIIEKYAKKENIPILLEIPYDREFAELYSKGSLFVSKYPKWKIKFQGLIKDIQGIIS